MYIQIAPIVEIRQARKTKPLPQNAHRLTVIAWYDEESRAHLLQDGWHASHLCDSSLGKSTHYGTAAPPQAHSLLPAIEPSTLAISTVARSRSPNSSPGAAVTLSDDSPPSGDSRTLAELKLLSSAVAQHTWECLRGG
ncbi:hypothetical protein FDECE_11137 [Fusarium decemcellulare]|nr:hypothetical protein FDECE_11137 [Fusarium decemcellulare]